MKKVFVLTLAFALLTAGILSGCSKQQESADTSDETAADTTEETSADTAEEAAGIDYMVLVNKDNVLPDGWEEALEITAITNSVGDEVQVESKAYEAYCALKEEVEKELEGYEKGEVKLELDSARRSVAEQQKIWDDFMEKYGEEYTVSHVAVPGFSEHQTGLALDLYFTVGGKEVYENEDLVQYTDIWEVIHSKLAEHGFILRYLDGREETTGYAYEPWHIRYIDDPETAKEIMDKGVTLEEYLGVSE